MPESKTTQAATYQHTWECSNCHAANAAVPKDSSGVKMKHASKANKRGDIAKTIHETRMQFCWGKDRNGRDPWPEKLPGDFGYMPQPWVDIAWEQAGAVLRIVEEAYRNGQYVGRGTTGAYFPPVTKNPNP